MSLCIIMSSLIRSSGSTVFFLFFIFLSLTKNVIQFHLWGIFSSSSKNRSGGRSSASTLVFTEGRSKGNDRDNGTVEEPESISQREIEMAASPRRPAPRPTSFEEWLAPYRDYVVGSISGVSPLAELDVGEAISVWQALLVVADDCAAAAAECPRAVVDRVAFVLDSRSLETKTPTQIAMVMSRLRRFSCSVALGGGPLRAARASLVTKKRIQLFGAERGSASVWSWVVVCDLPRRIPVLDIPLRTREYEGGSLQQRCLSVELFDEVAGSSGTSPHQRRVLADPGNRTRTSSSYSETASDTSDFRGSPDLVAGTSDDNPHRYKFDACASSLRRRAFLNAFVKATWHEGGTAKSPGVHPAMQFPVWAEYLAMMNGYGGGGATDKDDQAATKLQLETQLASSSDTTPNERSAHQLTKPLFMVYLFTSSLLFTNNINFLRVLEPYIQANMVAIVLVTGENLERRESDGRSSGLQTARESDGRFSGLQTLHTNDCLWRLKGQGTLLLNADLDEYLFFQAMLNPNTVTSVAKLSSRSNVVQDHSLNINDNPRNLKLPPTATLSHHLQYLFYFTANAEGLLDVPIENRSPSTAAILRLYHGYTTASPLTLVSTAQTQRTNPYHELLVDVARRTGATCDGEFGSG